MKNKKPYILVFFCLLQLISHAQETQLNPLISDYTTLNFEYLNTEDGLSNNYVTDLVQDSLGYIWIATMDGLNRYNGTEFLNLKNETDTINSLHYNFIEALQLNRKGQLCIASGAGLDVYDPKKESFSFFSPTNGLLGYSISCLKLGQKNELILGLYGKGIQFIDVDTPEKSMSLTHNSMDKNSISSNFISDILLEDKNTLWVGTNDQGLNKINYTTKVVEQILLNDKNGNINPKLNEIKCLFIDKQDNLWVGTNDGVVILHQNKKISYIKSSTKQGYGLTHNEVLSFEQDDFGNVWIGTQDGLNIVNLERYKNKTNGIKWLRSNKNKNNFFGRIISTILKDKAGNMWVGTDYGINYLNLKNVPIQHIKRNFSEPADATITDNYINILKERSNGDIWIGTNGGGLSLYSPSTTKYRHFIYDESKPNGISNNYIRALLEDYKNRIWVGTYRGGLNLLDDVTGISKKYLQGDVVDGNKVNVIYEDKYNTIWVGTNRGGLYKYNEQNDTFDYISSIGKLDIRAIAEDEKGNLWMATYGNGVLHYKPKENYIRFFNDSNTPGITNNIMYAILQLPDNNFLVGSAYNGLIKLYPKQKKAKQYNNTNGLSNNTVNSLLYKNENEIWLGTYKGISFYNTDTESIKNLNVYDNIAQSNFNEHAALKTKAGLLYFGSKNGFFIINPKNIFNTQEDTPLLFETLKIGNKKIAVSKNKTNGILSSSLPYLKQITIDYNQTSLISIDFNILKFPGVHNIKYSYQLEGYQDQWIDLKNSNSINFSKLPPGTYMLNVKGLLNPQKTISNSLLLTINPPFWKTLPAYLLYILITLGITWLGFRYYSERIKLKNSLLFEKKQRHLENELNLERVRFFTSFSHELKTPLSLIMAPVEELIDQTTNTNTKKQLKLVLKNATYLFKNIQKLLTFRKAEIGLHKLEIDRINISDYLTQTCNDHQSIAKSRGIDLVLHKPQSDIFIWVDIEKIEIIVHNLLSNAFKHSIRGQQIGVALETLNNNIQISVTDQGKGIHKEDLPHIFDWYYQSKKIKHKKGSGIGLALSKIFAELHLGSLHVKSKINQGATFTLRIPTDAFQEKTDGESAEVKKEPFLNRNEYNTSSVWKYTDTSNEQSVINAIISQEYDRDLLLVIDDNKDILQFLSVLLEKEYDLIFAEDGSEGIEKALKFGPDLIISDVMMPEKSGIDLCKTLKKDKSTSHIPIILLTAKGNEEGINEGFEEGADDYIQKPFNPKLLKTRIKNLIENRLKLKDYFIDIEKDTSDIELKNKNILDTEKAFLNQLEKVIHILIQNGNTNTELLCTEIGMSRTSLYRKIKVLTGHNINKFVRKVKLKKALQLIQHENYTISQASFTVGFNSTKYFRQSFKKEFGVLPSEYKKKAKQKD